MILQALTEYFVRKSKCADSTIAPEGFEIKNGNGELKFGQKQGFKTSRPFFKKIKSVPIFDMIGYLIF